MRSWLSWALAGAVAAAVAAPARAASVGVTGQFEVLVSGLSPVVVPLVPGATADVTGGVLGVPAGIGALTASIPITGFPLDLVTGLDVDLANGAGSFAAPGPSQTGPASVAGGALGGAMPISGTVATTGLVPISFSLSVVGVGGTQDEGDIVLYGAPWTVGDATVTLSDQTVFALSGSQTGALGAIGSQTVLVTPLRIDAYGLSEIPVFGRLTLNFVPEPGTGLLVAAGLLGLPARRQRSASA
jgi:hypothetical protein